MLSALLQSAHFDIDVVAEQLLSTTILASSWLTERSRFISTISWQRHPLRFGLGYIVAKQMVFNLTVQGHSLITPINVEFHPLVLVSELTLGYNTGVAFTFVTLPSPWIGATTLTDCNVFIRGVDKLPVDIGEVFL